MKTTTNNIQYSNDDSSSISCSEKLKNTNKTKWSANEDEKLKYLVEHTIEKPIKWKEIAKHFQNRTTRQCYSHFRQIDEAFSKGHWTTEEINKLKELIKKYGTNWAELSKHLTSRSGKQIRDHYICSKPNKVKFTKDEDKKILELYAIYGNKFAIIAKQMNNRSSDEIKNRFHSTIKKHLKQKTEANSLKNDLNGTSYEEKIIIEQPVPKKKEESLRDFIQNFNADNDGNDFNEEKVNSENNENSQNKGINY